MEEEDEGITRRIRGLPMGMDEENEEGITLNIYFFKNETFSL